MLHSTIFYVACCTSTTREFYLKEWKQMAKALAEDPGAPECRVWGDRYSGDTHDNIRHRHVNEIHSSIGPEAS